ncbi:MAG: integration host factor, actinobacterial type [Actinomycetota bacterium]
MPTPPPRSEEQKRAALAKAAHARTVLAELKAEVAAGEIDLAAVLARADEDEVVANVKLSKVLQSLPNMGKIKTKRLLEELEISESRRLRGVGPRQRERLLERLS